VDNGAAGNARELAGVAREGELPGGRVSDERCEAERSGRVHSARGDAVEVMHATRADKRGQERRTGDNWRRSSAAGWPRRQAQIGFRRNDACLTEQLHR